MNYTDKESIRASQIAYFTINSEVLGQVNDAIKNLSETNKAVKVNYTLYELYKYSETFKKSIYKGICSKSGLDYEVAKNLSREEILSHITDIKSKQVVSEKFDIIDDIVNGEIGSWKVVSYVDNNTIGLKGTAGKLVDGIWDHQDFSKSGDGTAAVVFETATDKILL